MHPTAMTQVALPRYAPIPQAISILGIGRSTLYREAAKGNIRLVKIGARSLVDIPHALDWMETLPEANISLPYERGK